MSLSGRPTSNTEIARKDRVKANGDHGRRWPRSRRTARATPLVLVALLVLAVTAALSSAATGKGSSGRFVLSGEVSAVLKVPAFLPPGVQTGCTISSGQAGTDVITWDNTKIKEAGKTMTVADLSVELDVSKYGGPYSMKVKLSGPTEGDVYLTTDDPYQWMSTSGSITINAGGKSGSVDGVLSDGTHHPGTITIKGSWSGCSTL